MPNPIEAPREDKKPYSVKELQIIDNLHRPYVIHILDFPEGLVSAKGDLKIQQLFDDILEFSHRDDIFPKTKPGEVLERQLIESLDHTSILVVCSLPKDTRIAGYSAFTRKHFKDLSVLHVGVAAVASQHNGGGLAYKMRIPILEAEKPDIIDGQTVNPRIYSTYQNVADNFGYEFYPQNITPPSAVVNFTRRFIQETSGEEAANQLDTMMVRRKYLPDTPTGKEVWKGDPLFESMGITKEDGVQLLLTKPGIVSSE